MNYPTNLDRTDEKEKQEMLKKLAESSAKSTFNSKVMKTQINTLKRCMIDNEQQRTAFADQPERFMESELQLDTAIKDLTIVSEHTELYSEFANSDALRSLSELLHHENVDIVLDVITLLKALYTELDFDTLREEKSSVDLLNAFV